ncbi:MAG: hypothetical protein MZW92_30000 [Comamonadaceae bacterium]|nr:hypothetical protein [Comamonadaceae bacterium]
MLGGKAGADAQRAAVQSQLDTAWTRRAPPMPRSPASRRSHSASMNWRATQQALAFDVAARRVDAPQSFRRHVAAIDGQLELLYATAVHTHIVMHPESSGFFLQDATLNHLPLLSELLGQMRASGFVVLVQQQATLAQRARLAGLVERARGVSGQLRARATALAVAADPALVAGYGARARRRSAGCGRGAGLRRARTRRRETLEPLAWTRLVAALDGDDRRPVRAGRGRRRRAARRPATASPPSAATRSWWRWSRCWR